MCGIFYALETPGSADCILMNDPIGHEGFMNHIIQCAIERHKRNSLKRTTTIRYNKSVGYGLYASRNLNEGEIVQVGEAQCHYLVTKQHAETKFSEVHKQWFKQYAWEIGNGNVFAIWSDKPTDWRPLNHSCDPNVWLNGLNVVARRPIPKGEQILMDYATFCGDNMQAFDCFCNSKDCRKKITGQDYLLPNLEEKYGDHVSPWVLSRRTKHLNGHT